MNTNRFTRSLLLTLLVAVLAVGAGIIPSSAAFVQCGTPSPGGDNTCQAAGTNDGVGSDQADIINGTNGNDFIRTDGAGDPGVDHDGDGDADGNDNNAGGNDTVFGNDGNDTINTDGRDTVFGGDGNDSILTDQDDDTIFPGRHTAQDGGLTGNEAADSAAVEGAAGSTQAGSGNDKINIFAGEVAAGAVMVVDCDGDDAPGTNPEGTNDVVNLIGFGPRVILDTQTNARQVDPITGGVIFIKNCERINGLTQQ